MPAPERIIYRPATVDALPQLFVRGQSAFLALQYLEDVESIAAVHQPRQHAHFRVAEQLAREKAAADAAAAAAKAAQEKAAADAAAAAAA